MIHITSLFEGYVDDAVTSIGQFDLSTPVTVSSDLIPILNPDQYLKPNARYTQCYLRKFEQLKQAGSYLAISEFTRQEGLAYLDAKEGCIVNVSTAIESTFQPIRVEDKVVANLRLKFGLTRPFVLYTGGGDERKNLPRLFQAFARLPPHLRTGHQLLLAGKMPEGHISELNRQAKAAGLKPDELRFSGYVTDEELIQLYNLCNLLFSLAARGLRSAGAGGHGLWCSGHCGKYLQFAGSDWLRRRAIRPPGLFRNRRKDGQGFGK